MFSQEKFLNFISLFFDRNNVYKLLYDFTVKSFNTIIYSYLSNKILIKILIILLKFSFSFSEIGRGVLHHRKSSLALTPEEEPLDINVRTYKFKNNTKYIGLCNIFGSVNGQQYKLAWRFHHTVYCLKAI